MEQRSIAYDAAVVDHMQADVSLVRRVREVFFTVLLSERRLAIARRNVELAEERLEQLRTLYEQGRASQLELLEARAAAINRKPELLSRRETLLTGQEELKQLTGLTAEDELRLDGEITDIELDLSDQEIRQTLFAESPELQRARLALTSAQVSRSLTSRETRLPRVSAGVSYSPGVTPAFDAEAWTSRETWRTGRFSLGLTVPLDPLVPGSRGDNNVEAAERAEVRAELSVEETEAELRRSAVEFARRLSFSREKLSLLEQSLEIARERYEQTVAAYESGGVELLDVEDAQTALEQAELELLQERYNLIMAVVELDARAGGAILDDGKVLSE
jgi:outer membrane protein TolC